MAIALPSLVGGGLGKQPGEGKGQEMGAQGHSEMPSASICVLGTEKLLGLQFPSSPSRFPGPWLFPAKEHLACRSLLALWRWLCISAGKSGVPQDKIV